MKQQKKVENTSEASSLVMSQLLIQVNWCYDKNVNPD